ncbi:hypothetical protein [Paenibacillus polymyxa]|uniref:hypothetical protein n=1 Tax=Paenibacillus polymyxa TaxID=1406 RepID=UPI0025B65AF0|nr:hypothetical protein [Paenibacillus polymyxa]MDN4090950.1 hypothetical protein [Paenibacillus polymyxa]
MNHQGSIWVDVPEQPQKTALQKKVERLINKREKTGPSFNDIELDVFSALGEVEWDEEKANWLIMKNFDAMYRKSYPNGTGYSL